MIRQTYILATLSLLMMACSDVETEVTTQPDEQIGSEVNFTISDEIEEVDWTRGTSIDSGDKITSVGVYAVRNSDDFTYYSYDKTLYIDNLSGVKQSSSVWHFSPALYYPYGEALKMFAYSPYDDISATSGVTTSFDLDDETITIEYDAPTLDGRNQPDLLIATALGNENNSGALAFNYTHALTKITLSARFTEYGSTTQVTNSDGEASDPEYYITSFTLNHIAMSGTLTCSASADGTINFDSENDSGEWAISQSSRNIIIASNAYVLPDPTGYYSDASAAVQLTDEFENIMGDEVLFMLPQRIETLPTEVYAYKPTITITIYEKITGKYYESAEMELPTPDADEDGTGDGFLMGQHINLRYAFSVDPLGEVTKVSLTPTVLSWYDFDVTVDIDPNIYILLEAENITSSGSMATVVLYTNSAVTPVITSDDFTISSISNTASSETSGAQTIADATLTAYTITIDTSSLSSGENDGVISVTAYADGYNSDEDTSAGKPDETSITKQFNLTITK